MKTEEFFKEKNIDSILINKINRVSIFDSFSKSELTNFLNSISCKVVTLDKDESLFHEGDFFPYMCILLDGEITLSSSDESGNRNIIDIVGEGKLFAEVFSFTNRKISPVTATSNCSATVFLIDTDRLLTLNTDDPLILKDKYLLVSKLLETFAEKNIILISKLGVVSRRNIREKIMHFLELQRTKSQSSIFEIPYSRKDMADFLGVDRSALSRELSRLKDEKIIDFEKNTFKILD